LQYKKSFTAGTSFLYLHIPLYYTHTPGKVFILLSLELLRLALLPLAGDKSQRHDTRDVHLRAKDLGVKAELLCSGLHVLKTLLVVGTGTSHPDGDVVLDQLRGEVSQRSDDTLEGAGDVGEVGNTTTDEENLAILVLGSAEEKVEDSSGVVVGLRLGGSTRVLTVVGELIGETSRGNGIGVNNGSTTTSNQSPDTALGVQDGKLQGSTSLSIEVSDVSLLLGQLTTEGGRELHRRTGIDADLAVGPRGNVGKTQSSGRSGNSPLGTTLEIGSLVQLGSKIEEVDSGGGLVLVGDDNKGVDLKVGELAVDVDGIKSGDEVDKDVVDTLGNLLEESSGNLLVGGVLSEVDGDQELLSLGVNITDINTTLVGEEDPIAL
jgi:hypothetical protein